MSVFVADAGDHVRRECGLTPGPVDSPLLYPRFLSRLGEVALQFAHRDQARAPLGLDGCDRRHDAPVECRQADVECLRGPLARVDEALDGSTDLAVGHGRRRDGPRGVPQLLLAPASLPPSRHRSPPRVQPYSNCEADSHLMMHLCLPCYRGQ
jgi:hypothetical protein